MEAGDYFVTATGGLVGWAIRTITHSRVNHTGIYIGEGLTVEACPRGASVGRIASYPRAIWSNTPLDYITRGLIVRNAKALIGTPYNFFDIAAQALIRVFGWHAPKWALDRASRPDRLQCAQLVDLAYRRSGIHLFLNRPKGMVAPSDLYDLIQEAKRG